MNYSSTGHSSHSAGKMIFVPSLEVRGTGVAALCRTAGEGLESR